MSKDRLIFQKITHNGRGKGYVSNTHKQIIPLLKVRSKEY